MTPEGTPGLTTSMVVAGSTVAVVGMVLSITHTMAFIMMIAFGVAVAAGGLVLSRRSPGSRTSEQEGTRQGQE